MTEWQVVGVLVTIVGLFATVGAPLIKNTKAMTELTVHIQTLTSKQEEVTQELKEFRKENSDAHRRLWDKNSEQDSRIVEMEKDLSVLAASVE